MPQYDIGFAAKLAQVADELDGKEPHNYDARRVVVYLSRVSAEITMKSLLENAGKPLNEIRANSHNLSKLLADLSECEIKDEIEPNIFLWRSASCVKDLYVDLGFVHIPIGTLIEAEKLGTSVYPNQIRYGEAVIDMEPSFLATMATILVGWAKRYLNLIRLKQLN
ncbi:MAG: hypothetical protein BVN34_00525 [Proteobacteria bacterium ST_bin12]|nr:MAG: hypothetical protein BVN34_00525 [Proteobacteria bacterium ST_bin12]